MAIAKKPKKHLTSQQRRLVKGLAQGKTITQAAIDAGYSENCPAQAGHQALEAIRVTMPAVLARHGLTDDSLIEKYLLPLLNAKETKFFAYEGRVCDEKDVVAWGPRRDGLDMAFKLRGDYVKEQKESTSLNVQFVTNVELPRR